MPFQFDVASQYLKQNAKSTSARQAFERGKILFQKLGILLV